MNKLSDLVSRISAALASVFTFVALYAIFIVVPPEQKMGIIQKIFYFHVPAAWISFLSFGVVFVASILYLWKQEERYDQLAHASGEIGLVFCTLVLITGPIWGRPVWGVWWTWDSRLTTTLVLWLIYVAYLMVRAYGGNRGPRYGAVLGIVGFLDVPIVYFSIRWWRTIHPPPVTLAPSMVVTLLISLVAFTLLYLCLLLQRVAQERMKDEIDGLKRQER